MRKYSLEEIDLFRSYVIRSGKNSQSIEDQIRTLIQAEVDPEEVKRFLIKSYEEQIKSSDDIEEIELLKKHIDKLNK